MAEYRGPECPKCKVKSHQIEFGRVAYWYCRKCKEEVKDTSWSAKPPAHSLTPCEECGGTAAHDYFCKIVMPKKKGK